MLEANPQNAVLFLDGGLGTTLEDVFHKDIKTRLWSAQPIDKEPEVIVDTHLAFLRAGSDIILTSTYQCAFNTFEAAGYSREDAVRLMRKSVALAQEAKSRFLAERPDIPPANVKIALSLGPFGATLYPAQEFDGYYPPPYGPKGFSATNSADNRISFDNAEDEERAIIALTEFHLERLHVFSEDQAAWDAIDCIAFETVPLIREIRAIRRVMNKLEHEAGKTKTWWISSTYPDGIFPDKRPSGESVTTREVVQAMLRQDPRTLPTTGATEAIPDGVGVNCTGVEHLPYLLWDITSAVEEIGMSSRPWLIVYPNGGDVWDPHLQQWLTRQGNSGGEEQSAQWATQLKEAVRPIFEKGTWRGVILGGCCKVGPREIAMLSKTRTL